MARMIIEVMRLCSIEGTSIRHLICLLFPLGVRTIGKRTTAPDPGQGANAAVFSIDPDPELAEVLGQARRDARGMSGGGLVVIPSGVSAGAGIGFPAVPWSPGVPGACIPADAGIQGAGVKGMQ